jgi:hypothetical protein
VIFSQNGIERSISTKGQSQVSEKEKADAVEHISSHRPRAGGELGDNLMHGTGAKLDSQLRNSP